MRPAQFSDWAFVRRASAVEAALAAGAIARIAEPAPLRQAPQAPPASPASINAGISGKIFAR